MVKNLPAMQETRFDLWSGSSPGEENGNPLQYSFLENLMDRGAWWATAHWVARVRHDIVTKPPPPLVKQALVKQEMYIKQENSHPGWSEHVKQNSIKKKKVCWKIFKNWLSG